MMVLLVNTMTIQFNEWMNECTYCSLISSGSPWLRPVRPYSDSLASSVSVEEKIRKKFGWDCQWERQRSIITFAIIGCIVTIVICIIILIEIIEIVVFVFVGHLIVILAHVVSHSMSSKTKINPHFTTILITSAHNCKFLSNLPFLLRKLSKNQRIDLTTNTVVNTLTSFNRDASMRVECILVRRPFFALLHQSFICQMRNDDINICFLLLLLRFLARTVYRVRMMWCVYGLVSCNWVYDVKQELTQPNEAANISSDFGFRVCSAR